MRKIKDTENCLNCYFLCSKQTHPTLGDQSSIISKKVRKDVSTHKAAWPITYQTDLFPTAFCEQGHWNENSKPKDDSLYETITVPRKECFYPYQDNGMTLECAKKNWNEENTRKNQWSKHLEELSWKIASKLILGVLGLVSISVIAKCWKWLISHFH